MTTAGGRSDAAASFLFADIAGFTALTEAHGDEEAFALVNAFCEAIRAELPLYGGTYVKAIGDAVMLRVPDPGKAIGLGLRIVGGLLGGHAAPEVAVGVHHGPAIEHDGDYYGAAVNTAARVAALAASGEVLVTGATAALVPDLEGVIFESRGRHELRNCAGARQDLCELAARGRDARPAPSRPGLQDGRRPGPRGWAPHVRGQRPLLLLAHVRGRVRSRAGEIRPAKLRRVARKQSVAVARRLR